MVSCTIFPNLKWGEFTGNKTSFEKRRRKSEHDLHQPQKGSTHTTTQYVQKCPVAFQARRSPPRLFSVVSPAAW
jgi:hypothetical protein